MTAPTTRWVRVGTVGKPWGVRGGNRITSDTEEPRQVFKYAPWVLERDGTTTQVTFKELRSAGATLAAIIESTETPEAAAQWVGSAILVDREQIKTPRDGFLYVDLEGCAVVNLHGEALGSVVRVFHNGANDVLETHGDRVRLLPFVIDTWVKSVDLTTRRIVLDWDADF
jgi:16S rRNA processing protein RimM